MKHKTRRRKRLKRRERLRSRPIVETLLAEGLRAGVESGRRSFLLLNIPAIVVDAALAIFLAVLLYRLRLYARLFSHADLPFSISGADTPVPFLIYFIWQDLALGLAMSLILLGVVLSLKRLFKRRIPPGLRPVAITLLSAFIFLFALGHFLHYHLIFFMNTGLVFDLMVEAVAGISPGSMLSYAAPVDYLFLTLPVIFFWVSLFLPHTFRFFRNIAAGLIFAILLAFIAIGIVVRPTVAQKLASNPIVFFVRDAIDSLSRPVEKSEIFDAGDQSRMVAFVHPVLARPERSSRQVYEEPEQANVIFIVLESTGFSYLFDTTKGNEMPMPFLNELSKKSLIFMNHFSTSNSSARSLFSIFSGLYADPQTHFYVTAPDIHIPSFFSFVKGDKFLFTPGSMYWYFPRGFFQNSSLREMYGFEELYTIPRKNDFSNVVFARDERLVMDKFIERLDAAREPFYSVYYSFLSHWPYTDYGREYYVVPGPQTRLFKYYQNLRLMDTQIRRVVEQLKKKNQWKRTVLIITGDHGEAFGQHEGNFLHSRASFNENVQVPLIIHAPFLIRPAVIQDYTSHADIVPTLLDLLHINYNPLLFQGESHLSGKPSRKYIFFYGNEDSMSAISEKGHKIYYDFRYRSCHWFDLSADPAEKRSGSCQRNQEGRQAVLFLKENQLKMLKDYNAASQRQEPFHGQSHPEGPGAVR